MQARFPVGSHQIENPLRLSDLIHSQNATLARTEEVIARDRLEVSRVEPLAWGFEVNPRLSQPFVEWMQALRRTHHLWLDSAELDPFATTVILSHVFHTDSDANPFHKPLDSPLGAWAALCPWYWAVEAVAYLRREVLGPLLLAAYGADDLFRKTIREITADLALSEGSFNSVALPLYCQTEGGGIVLRLNRPNVARVLDYFNAEEPDDGSIPTVVTLGGLIDTVYAAGPSEVRLAICPAHCTPQAIDSLSCWLHSTKSTAKAKAGHNLLPA
jgi:hypothetical protein